MSNQKDVDNVAIKGFGLREGNDEIGRIGREGKYKRVERVRREEREGRREKRGERESKGLSKLPISGCSVNQATSKVIRTNFDT